MDSSHPAEISLRWDHFSLCTQFLQSCPTRIFHPSTFCYYRFSIETEFKMQLGVLERCKLWLKHHANLLKPLEPPFLDSRLHSDNLSSNMSFVNTKCFQRSKINSWFLSTIIAAHKSGRDC